MVGKAFVVVGLVALLLSLGLPLATGGSAVLLSELGSPLQIASLVLLLGGLLLVREGKKPKGKTKAPAEPVEAASSSKDKA